MIYGEITRYLNRCKYNLLQYFVCFLLPSDLPSIHCPKKSWGGEISITKLLQMFPDEASCYQWLEQIRWDGKPVCPRCKNVEGVKPSPSRPHHYWHKQCRRYFTVTTGTCMHSRKKGLQGWIFAIYSVLTARKGVSAMQLSKEIGVQYRTAWYMLHRIREACGNGEFTLSYVVEADETYIGGKDVNKHASKRLNAGRGIVGKTVVAGVRKRGRRVVAQPVKSTEASTLILFVSNRLEPGTIVNTDEARAYRSLPNVDNLITHKVVKHSSGSYARGEVLTNGIESVWSVLKRSIHGTWHHVSPKHLRRYVDEATFRLNEGNCEVDILDRMAALIRRLTDSRLPYSVLVAESGLSNHPQKAV